MKTSALPGPPRTFPSAQTVRAAVGRRRPLSRVRTGPPKRPPSSSLWPCDVEMETASSPLYLFPYFIERHFKTKLQKRLLLPCYFIGVFGETGGKGLFVYIFFKREAVPRRPAPARPGLEPWGRGCTAPNTELSGPLEQRSRMSQRSWVMQAAVLHVGTRARAWGPLLSGAPGRAQAHCWQGPVR